MLEVPENADPMEDQFAKKQSLKSEKVAKNEIKRMRNIVKAKKIPIPRTGYLGPEAAASTDVRISRYRIILVLKLSNSITFDLFQFLTAATVAKASTASVGKFQDKLPKEKPARGLGVKELIPGIKRKASHIGNVDEKTANLELINSVLSKKPKYDVDKAVSVQKREAREE